MPIPILPIIKNALVPKELIDKFVVYVYFNSRITVIVKKVKLPQSPQLFRAINKRACFDYI